MRGGIPRREYLQVLHPRLVGQDDLFAPVAHEVAIPRGIRLGTVDERLVVAIHRERTAVGRRMDDVILDELARERAVEPDGHAAAALLALGVDGGLGAVLLDVVALIVEELAARILRQEVAHEAAPHVVVAGAVLLPDHLAVAGIVEGHHGLARLQAMEHLQALALRQELAYVVGIAMTKPRVPKSDAIVVDSHGAIHHLVDAVAVEVGHVQRVVALSGIGAVALTVLAAATVGGVEAPTASELTVAPVPRLDDGTGIDAAAKHHGGQTRLVEAAHADAERAGTLPVVVAPGRRRSTVDEVVAGELAARLAIDDGDELRTSGVVVVYPTGTRRVEVAPRAIVNLSIAIGIRDFLAVAKDGSLAGADGHLGTAVAIEVGNGKGRGVAEDDARATLDAPEERAVELIGIPDDGIEAVLLGVAGARAVADDVARGVLHALQALHDDFELAVTIEVAHAHVVGGIYDFLRVGIDVLGVAQGNADVRLCGRDLRPCERERR